MRKTPEFEDCFAKLIAIPSVSSIDPAHDQSNRGVIDLLANYFEAAGFSIEIMPLPDTADKFNLIARRGQVKNGAGLVLSGHTDTVPCDPDGWRTDPFRLTQKDGNYYGLGTADMKSFFPVIFKALERLAGVQFRQGITVIATADEESTMAGARALQITGEQPGRYCLIGEPTGLIPRRLHKGIMIETIRLQGRSGHSSDPSLGCSALEGMNRVMNALLSWRDALQRENRHQDFTLPTPTLNLGRIQGGDSANRICANCELSIDLRMLPGMSPADLKRTLHRIVESAVAGSGLTAGIVSACEAVPPMCTPIDSEIVRVSERLTAAAGSVAFGTEGPFFNAMGMETVILGPGDIDVAHRPNEYLQINRIEPMIDILSKIISHFCGDA